MPNLQQVGPTGHLSSYSQCYLRQRKRACPHKCTKQFFCSKRLCCTFNSTETASTPPTLNEGLSASYKLSHSFDGKLQVCFARATHLRWRRDCLQWFVLGPTRVGVLGGVRYTDTAIGCTCHVTFASASPSLSRPPLHPPHEPDLQQPVIVLIPLLCTCPSLPPPTSQWINSPSLYPLPPPPQQSMD